MDEETFYALVALAFGMNLSYAVLCSQLGMFPVANAPDMVAYISYRDIVDPAPLFYDVMWQTGGQHDE